MSITSDQLDAKDGELHSTWKIVTGYLKGLGLPTGDQLPRHASEHRHEDVGSEASSISATRTPSPIYETISPGRLRCVYPPSNYGAVIPGKVYRSSFPSEKNYDFLRGLNLKTIITLVDDVPFEYESFIQAAGMQHFKVHINANKGGVRVQACDMNRALNVILDRSNHPVLIHCNKGKHRTGCTVAVLRRLQGVDLDAIREEYHTYADPKARFWDEAFFEHFNLNTVMWRARQEDWTSADTEDSPLLSPPPSPASVKGFALKAA